MKRFATLFVALGLATAGSTALADQAKDQLNKQKAKPQPVQMTEAQLDNVAGGLVDIVLVDVVDVEKNNLAVAANVPINAAVAAFGSFATATQTRPGRINVPQNQ
jgi:hypothetical protein